MKIQLYEGVTVGSVKPYKETDYFRGNAVEELSSGRIYT